MLHSIFHQHHHHIPLSLTHHRHHNTLHKPTRTSLHIVSAVPPTAAETLPWLITQLVSSGGAIIEIPAVSKAATPFALTATNIDTSSTVQVASSVLLTGATAAYFFRAVLSRVKRAKQLKFRSSSGGKKSKSAKAKAKATPDQALLGAIIAGVMAFLLYKMTTSIESALSHQTISNNFSVRQVTITIRTMISGICYLATFIYGFNCIGLFLYSGHLAMDNFMEKETKSKISEQSCSSNSSIESLTSSNNNDLSTVKEDQSPNKSQ